MSKLVLISTLLFLICSCVNQNPSDNYTNCPIPPKDFQYIIKNTFLINAHLENDKKFKSTYKDSIGDLTIKIIQDKGFQKEDFLESINCYSSKPFLLDSLIKDIKDSIQELKSKLLPEDED
jgi:hypothetical protein